MTRRTVRQVSGSGMQQQQNLFHSLRLLLLLCLHSATKESKENAAVTLESAHSVKKSVTDMVQASNGVKEVAHDINDSVSTFRIE